MLSQPLVMCMEIMKLVWQNVSVRDEVVLLPSEALLHLDIVVTQAVFACNLVALREVVDSLMLIEALIHVAFARGRRPAQVPLVRLSAREGIGFKNRSNNFRFAFQHFVKHLVVVNVVASMSLHWASYKLLFINRLHCMKGVAAHCVCIDV